MSIKARTITLRSGPQVAASGTDVAIAMWVAPAAGKIKSVKSWIQTKTGSNAAQLNIYKSGAAGSTAAASTTSILSAAMDMTSDAQVSGTLSSTDSAIKFISGEVLYLKATTGATTTMDDVNVTITVDY